MRAYRKKGISIRRGVNKGNSNKNAINPDACRKGKKGVRDQFLPHIPQLKNPIDHWFNFLSRTNEKIPFKYTSVDNCTG